jgi:peptidoglycan/LPS O-acetylase OafA/YrhL
VNSHRYQPHIDGLRAIAVIAVVLYHADIPLFRGGFLGVDVFFVISGYLITGIIWPGIQDGSFSLATFYERRIRRIMPALFVVLAFVLAGAWLLFLPGDFRRVPGSTEAALAFLSNIKFYRESGYFDAPSKLNPLLHTWSLGVEERYYLFYPISLILLHRYAAKFVAIIMLVVATASLAAFLLIGRHTPALAFFAAFTRAWELLAGSLLALHTMRAGKAASRVNARSSEIISAAGLLLIAAGIFGYDAGGAFPAATTLLPVAGTTLILYAAGDTRVARVLAIRPLVAIGLISYSLYLWHWPLLVFAAYTLERALDPVQITLAIASAVVLSFLSWRFIERPLRLKSHQPVRLSFPRVLWVTTGAALALVFACVSARSANAARLRVPDEARRLEAYADSFTYRTNRCNRTATPCHFGADVQPAFALWGDSHGIELVVAIGAVAAKHGQAIEQFTYPACAPALADFYTRLPDCAAFEQQVLDRLAHDHAITSVVLVANLDDDRYRRDPHFFKTYGGVVHRLQNAGKGVVIVYPIPTHTVEVPRALARRQQAGSREAFETPTKVFLDRNRTLLAFLDTVGGDAVTRIRPHELLCATSTCMVQHNRDVLYVDTNHLTTAGGRRVAALFEPIFQGSK